MCCSIKSKLLNASGGRNISWKRIPEKNISRKLFPEFFSQNSEKLFSRKLFSRKNLTEKNFSRKTNFPNKNFPKIIFPNNPENAAKQNLRFLNTWSLNEKEKEIIGYKNVIIFQTIFIVAFFRFFVVLANNIDKCISLLECKNGTANNNQELHRAERARAREWSSLHSPCSF